MEIILPILLACYMLACIAGMEFSVLKSRFPNFGCTGRDWIAQQIKREDRVSNTMQYSLFREGDILTQGVIYLMTLVA